jgi:hypothetical protein
MRLLLPLLALPLAVLLAPPAPRAQVGATASPFLMVDEARQRGVEFRQTNFATEMKYPFETLGGAVAAFDFDADGWKDIFVAGSHVVDKPYSPAARYEEGCFLYRLEGTRSNRDAIGARVKLVLGSGRYVLEPGTRLKTPMAGPEEIR